MPLGRALAFLEFELAGGQIAQTNISEKAFEDLSSFRKRLQELKIPATVEKIFSDKPLAACQTDKSFLQGSNDFLLAFVLLIKPDESLLQKYCEWMTSHLNDCFWCFEVYSEVMRDYFAQSQELR